MLLRGAAKIAVESTVGFSSWALLREVLLNEFAVRISDREVHDRLRNRKRDKSESLLAYAYSMRKLSNLGTVDEGSLLAYIIAGIQNEPINKAMMYTASTFG